MIRDSFAIADNETLRVSTAAWWELDGSLGLNSCRASSHRCSHIFNVHRCDITCRVHREIGNFRASLRLLVTYSLLLTSLVFRRQKPLLLSFFYFCLHEWLIEFLTNFWGYVLIWIVMQRIISAPTWAHNCAMSLLLTLIVISTATHLGSSRLYPFRFRIPVVWNSGYRVRIFPIESIFNFVWRFSLLHLSLGLIG